MQRAQAAVLNTLTDSKQFDKNKISKKAKDDKPRAPVNWTTQKQTYRYCRGIHQPRQCPAYGKTCAECSKHFREVCHSRRSKVVNEMEQEIGMQATTKFALVHF